jgi:uncharacterized RDD family membrane protein YckC
MVRGQVAARVPGGVPVAGDEQVVTGSAQVVLVAAVMSIAAALACLLWIRRQGLRTALVMSGAAAVLFVVAPGLLRFEGGIPSDPNTRIAGLEGYMITVESGWLVAVTMAELAMVVAACVLAYLFAPPALMVRRQPGWWRCLGSAAIDTSCVLFAALIVGVPMRRAGVVPGGAPAFWLALVVVTPIYCLGFQMSRLHATPGALVAGISIIDRDGTALTARKALTRSLALVATRVGPFAAFIGERHLVGEEIGVLLCIGVSLLVPLLLFERRSLHDIAADTQLVQSTGGARDPAPA